MLSHLPFSHFATSFNPAVSAVIWFYFISGYLMYGSFAREQKRKSFWQQSLFFYAKRILRIFPLYLLVLIATIVAMKIFGISQIVPLLHQELTLEKIVLNIALLPNNYVFAPLQIDALLPHPLVPPSWSVATEWHFYLLVPSLFLLRRSFWIVALFAGSMVFELWAFTQAEWSDAFGYRYIFGLLWIFGLGFLAAAKVLWWRWLYGTFLLYSFVAGFAFFHHHYAQEITLGIALFPLLLNIIETKKSWWLDSYLGRLSYPIFLLHFLVFFVVEKSVGYESRAVYYFVVFLTVFLLANLLAFIEAKYIVPFKKRL